jgi:hypothetical protein
MDFERAELHFRILQAQHNAGELDEEGFRVEVAKLLFQDERGVFWMIDADRGVWFCNRGEGWAPCDPRSEPPLPPDAGQPPKRGPGRLLALGLTLLALLAVAGFLVLWQGDLDFSWNPFRPTPAADTQVTVSIASPANGARVALGQEIAIESTIDAVPNLQAVHRVELQVNGLRMDVRSVESKVRAEDTSFPLAQSWRPESVGEYQVQVIALSSENRPLSAAAITLRVEKASDETHPEPACVPDATFVADVTIPPGTAFPPGARMEKVWQVQNSGSCAWGVGYKLVQLEETGLIAPDTVPVPPTAAGETVDLAVTLWAPPEAGTYAQVWQMRSPEGGLFGPTLPLTIEVEALAQEDLPPDAPSDLSATIYKVDTGAAVPGSRPHPPSVHLTWTDQSDNEDAFRIYRADREASIGLAPADAEVFVDEEVACGNIYFYSVVAINAAGTSAESVSAEVTLPPCSPADSPPALGLTIIPTQVRASETFTVLFEASDDLGLDLVVVWGVETEDLALDSGRVFTCTEVPCAGTWPLTWTQPTSIPLTVIAVALDSSGQKSEPAWLTVTILPPELVTPHLAITEEVLASDTLPLDNE